MSNDGRVLKDEIIGVLPVWVRVSSIVVFITVLLVILALCSYLKVPNVVTLDVELVQSHLVTKVYNNEVVVIDSISRPSCSTVNSGDIIFYNRNQDVRQLELILNAHDFDDNIYEYAMQISSIYTKIENSIPIDLLNLFSLSSKFINYEKTRVGYGNILRIKEEIAKKNILIEYLKDVELKLEDSQDELKGILQTHICDLELEVERKYNYAIQFEYNSRFNSDECKNELIKEKIRVSQMLANFKELNGVKSSADGRIFYTSSCRINETIPKNTHLATIVPLEVSPMYGLCCISQEDKKCFEIGQKVDIKLSGPINNGVSIIEGRVEHIIPQSEKYDEYLVMISLKDNLNFIEDYFLFDRKIEGKIELMAGGGSLMNKFIEPLKMIFKI